MTINEFEPRGVVCALDFEQPVDGLLDTAISIAQRFDATLHLVHVWLPNVNNGTQGPQVLCLGSTVSAGIRTVQIMHQIFGALTLQTVQLNALDPAGVLSREAAEYWQQPANLKCLPLTHEPFLCPDEV